MLHYLSGPLASEQVLHSSDGNPRSKGEVYCGKCLSRIFVVSTTSMPPSSLPDRASYFDAWVIQLFFMIFPWISSLRVGFFMLSIRLTLLVTSECFVGHSLRLDYFHFDNVCSFLDSKNTSQFFSHQNVSSGTHVWFILYSYTICPAHSSLLINVERINEWWVNVESTNEFLDSAFPQTSVLV